MFDLYFNLLPECYITSLQGGAGNARIGIVTAASSNPEGAYQSIIEMFLTYGARSAVWIPIHRGNRDANSDPTVVDQILQQTGFYFSGGGQSRITDS